MQTLFNFIKQHVLSTVLVILLMVAVASTWQTPDPTRIFHAIGYAAGVLALVLVASMFLGNEDHA